MDIKKPKIVIITSGQPSINPRLVKEADALVEAGYKVKVIYQYRTVWASRLDLSLLATKKWDFVCVGGSPTSERIQYAYTRVRYKIGRFLAKYIDLKNNIAELALGRCTWELAKEAKKTPATIYIAHNLAALPAATSAAKHYNVKCGFDAEDFHRQEQTDDIENFSYRLSKFIEDKYLSKVHYFSTSSTLIAKEYQKIYPDIAPIIINNVFPLSFLQTENLVNNGEQLKLFWFSQTIGRKRGIEDAIKAIALLKKDNISLTILGHVSEDDKNYFQALANEITLKSNQLNFAKPINPDDIFSFASKFDIGLALETGFCLNNNIALSNKLFTYLTAGLAVIASETDAQKDFLKMNPTIGASFPIGDINSFSNKIKMFENDKQLLLKTKRDALNIAKNNYNWEKHSGVLVYKINNLLEINLKKK